MASDRDTLEDLLLNARIDAKTVDETADDLLAAGWRPPAQVIETVEQLAELRFLTIVREVVRSSPSGANYGAVWERRSSGWQCIAGSVAPRSEPKLPAELLWSPTEKAGQ